MKPEMASQKKVWEKKVSLGVIQLGPYYAILDYFDLFYKRNILNLYFLILVIKNHKIAR
jgi:hypothetical protein